MFEREPTNRKPEPDDVYILTEHLMVKETEETAAFARQAHERSVSDRRLPTSHPEPVTSPSIADHVNKEVSRPAASPLSSVIGHLVYGRVISREDAERVSPTFAAYLQFLAGTEKNAYDREVGDGTISRTYFFGKVVASTPLTSPAISLSSALRLPDEDWRVVVENAWKLIPEAYRSTTAFKGPDIMLLITNMTPGV